MFKHCKAFIGFIGRADRSQKAGVRDARLHLRQRLALLVLCLALPTLSACTAVTSDVVRTAEHVFTPTPDAELSSEEIDALQYTAVYARWGDGPQALVVLGFVDSTGGASQLSWVTQSRETLVTERGRVVQTSGLEKNVLGLSNRGADPLRCVLSSGCPRSWVRQVDYEGAQQNQTETIVSRFEVMETQTLELPKGPKEVTYVHEYGHFVFTEEAFVNEFWLADDGHVVQSRQYLIPELPALTIQQVNWVGRD